MKLLKSPETVIEAWMLSTLRGGTVERYDDLHLDQIDKRWISREHWIDAGLKVYNMAIYLRDEHRLSMTVAIVFSLQSGEERLGMNFRTLQGLADCLDWSPPSLYLFPQGNEPWLSNESLDERASNNEDSDVLWHTVDWRTLFGVELKGVGYFIEFKPPQVAEYSRTILVAG
jgi:hypothetical protein